MIWVVEILLFYLIMPASKMFKFNVYKVVIQVNGEIIYNKIATFTLKILGYVFATVIAINHS